MQIVALFAICMVTANACADDDLQCLRAFHEAVRGDWHAQTRWLNDDASRRVSGVVTFTTPTPRETDTWLLVEPTHSAFPAITFTRIAQDEVIIGGHRAVDFSCDMTEPGGFVVRYEIATGFRIETFSGDGSIETRVTDIRGGESRPYSIVSMTRP